MDGEIPVEARDFIAAHIASVEHLEILLLLQESRERDWTAREMNDRIRSQEASVAKWLVVLTGRGLATESAGRYRFAPATPELERKVAAVAAAYRERRIRVVEFIFSKPNEKILSFAQAFDLRKKP